MSMEALCNRVLLPSLWLSLGGCYPDPDYALCQRLGANPLSQGFAVAAGGHPRPGSCYLCGRRR